MIKNVLIPESIGSYYLFPKRIIGFDLGKTHIRATQVVLKGRTCTIERWFEQALPTGPATNYEERASQAIQSVLNNADSYDAIHTILPSSLVIFKEIKLPFTSRAKIKMVVDFEIEPLLPFSLNEAIIDFIITKQIPEEHSSELLVAAVQKQHVAHHISIFTAAGVNPEVVSVDFFALYGLYKESPFYASLPNGVALIDLGSQSTRIAYIQDGQLRLIRSLPKGTLSYAKTASTILTTDSNAVMENLVRFGIKKADDPAYDAALSSALTPFWDDISFTLNSFLMQTNLAQTIKHIFILGSGAYINGLEEFVRKKTGIPCQQLNIHTLIENKYRTSTHKNGMPNAQIMSLSAAIPTATTSFFNLRKKELSPTVDTTLFFKQLMAASGLILLLFGSLAVHYFIQTRTLSNGAYQAEVEAREALQAQFRNIPVSDLDDMIEQAQDEIKKEEKLWAAFNPARASFLQYILELTNKVDQEALSFTIDKLQLSDHTMKITAHVRDYDALILLEKELRQSKLFRYVEKQNDPDFTMTIKLTPNV